MNKTDFIKALNNNDMDALITMPKSDLHCHIGRGCNRKYFENLYNVKFPNVPYFKNIKEMDDYYDSYIDKYACKKSGYLLRLYFYLLNASKHNIIKSSPEFCVSSKKYFNNDLKEFINYLKVIFVKYAPNIEVFPELSLSRNDDLNYLESIIESLLEMNFFTSIDLMGDERLGTKEFQDIYQLARKKGLVLKAHVGEFTDSSYIEEALNNLDLDCINHGLSLVESDNLMEYVKREGIMVNVCPSSNLYLSRISSYHEHPVRTFVDKGITCSLNTDDEIIFNNSIENEYFNLFNSGCLTGEELYEIKENGLNKCLNLRRYL